MTVPAEVSNDYQIDSKILERLLADGDLAQLSPAQRTQYYLQTCKSMNLNPLTQPFAYIRLNNKLCLYPTRNCTDQLRKLHKISINVLSQTSTSQGLYIVNVRATDPSGRTDEDCGCVAIGDKIAPEFRSNLQMRAMTKAKRRVTLSICGLSWPDESELPDIPGVEVVEGKKENQELNALTLAAAEQQPPPHDPDTGEIIESTDILEARRKLAAAAGQGTEALQKAWLELPNAVRKILEQPKEDFYKPIAVEVDLRRQAP